MDKEVNEIRSTLLPIFVLRVSESRLWEEGVKDPSWPTPQLISAGLFV